MAGENWKAAGQGRRVGMETPNVPGTVIYVVLRCALNISVYTLNIEQDLETISCSTYTFECDVKPKKKLPEPVLKIDLTEILGPGVIIIGFKLYLIGGQYNISNAHEGVMRFVKIPYKRSDRVFIYDLQHNSMCTAPSMFSAKYAPYCVLVDGKICVFEATVTTERAPNFELFDLDCLTWFRLPELPERTVKIQACCVKKTTLYISSANAIYCIDVASKQSDWKHYPCSIFPFHDIGYCIDWREWDVCFTTNGNIDSFSKLCRPYKPPECFDWRNTSACPPPPTEEEKVGWSSKLLPFHPSIEASPLVRFGTTIRLTPLAGGRGDNGGPRFAIVRKGFMLPEDDWNLPRCPHIIVDVIEVVKKEVLPLPPFKDGKWSGTYEFLLINKLKSSAYSMDCVDNLDLYDCFSQ